MRLESPLLNLRLSKLVAAYNSPVYRLGSAATYIAFKTKYLSSNFATLFQIAEFTHPFCKNFYLPTFSALPLILVGQSALSKLGESITVSATVEFLSRIRKITLNANFFTLCYLEFNSFSILNTYSSRIHALDAGLNTCFSKTFYGNTLNVARGGKYRVGTLIFYSLGFDHISFKDTLNAHVAAAENLWAVYQGTHGNGVAASAHLVLPIFSYVESAMFYRNLLGDVKKSKVAVERGKIAYEQEELNLQRNVYTAFTDAKGALNSYEASLVTLEARQEAFISAKERFEVGLMNAFDYNQSQTLLVNAQSEVLRTKYDYIFRTKILEFYFGIPLIQNN